MKYAHSSFFAAAILLLNIPATIATAAEPGTSCEFRPVLLEEFDEETAPNRRIETITSNRIGPARWTAHTPWNGDFGDAQFMDPHPRGPFSMKDGMLSITASKNSEGKWTSGLIAAADSTGAGFGTRYGYFEVRMKMPPGPGTWPAFWLAALKPADQRDGNVEIDVIEYYGQFTDSYRSVVHVWFNDPAKHRGKDEKIRRSEQLSRRKLPHLWCRRLSASDRFLQGWPACLESANAARTHLPLISTGESCARQRLANR